MRLRSLTRSCFVGLLFFALHTPCADAAEKIRVATGGLAASSAAVWQPWKPKLSKNTASRRNISLSTTAPSAARLCWPVNYNTLYQPERWRWRPTCRLDLTIIGGVLLTSFFQSISRPEIKTAEGLKGKRIAISRFGSASDFAAREALKKLRLDPAKDAMILQVGGQSARYAALAQNSVQAAVFNEPLSTITVKKQKMTLLADLANLDLPFPNTDYIVRREHLQTHRSQTVNFMKAILEGMRALKTNRALAIRSDSEVSQNEQR